MVSIGSPWRTVRLLVRLGAGQGIADDVVKAAAVLLAALLVVLLMSALAGRAPGPGGWPWPGGLDALALVCTFAFAFGWLMAWPYVLPWYDGLGWALLALLPQPAPWSGRSAGLVGALDWLMLARTTALGFGYLPARGISLPSDVAWLRPVFRNAVTPLVLLTLLVILLLLLVRRPRRSGGLLGGILGLLG